MDAWTFQKLLDEAVSITDSVTFIIHQHGILGRIPSVPAWSLPLSLFFSRADFSLVSLFRGLSGIMDPLSQEISHWVGLLLLFSRCYVCDPMDCSMPGSSVFHCLPEFAQIHVHRVSDAIQPSCPLSSLLLRPSVFLSNRVFSNESALCIRWPKYWSFSVSPSNKYSGLISFRIDWFDLLAVQGTVKTLLQYHSSKASAFFMAQLSHLYMTTCTVYCLHSYPHNKVLEGKAGVWLAFWPPASLLIKMCHLEYTPHFSEPDRSGHVRPPSAKVHKAPKSPLEGACPERGGERPLTKPQSGHWGSGFKKRTMLVFQGCLLAHARAVY